MRVTLELVRTSDGRLEGSATVGAGPERRFSGTLELLRILLDLPPEKRAVTPR
ncbi:hypothetical protein [Actinomycetospora sp. NBRC 106378]|uniref:hypothetical protein n=1 Tax=Actinomycetospora sp. NBRC 106378 TaxID=3032208 RepID=UPI0024A48D70|nr:hypothetical protein [Actinomycetospora sp. NBRC 106378]GLZ50740.1 hypothetical protein Acsp07_03570 [Actinomycetospora sp. NBRC 106378]